MAKPPVKMDPSAFNNQKLCAGCEVRAWIKNFNASIVVVTPTV
jgi:hypothetical protein